MENSSVNSLFRFEGYKIDRIHFSIFPSVEFLKFKTNLAPEGWKFQFGIRQPAFFKHSKEYVGGLDLKITYPNTDKNAPENQKDIINLSIGIAGLFSVSGERFEKETEDALVKLQMPTILFPYIRSTVTSLLANAGLGSMLFPLVNVYELAKNLDIKISEIE